MRPVEPHHSGPIDVAPDIAFDMELDEKVQRFHSAYQEAVTPTDPCHDTSVYAQSGSGAGCDTPEFVITDQVQPFYGLAPEYALEALGDSNDPGGAPLMQAFKTLPGGASDVDLADARDRLDTSCGTAAELYRRHVTWLTWSLGVQKDLLEVMGGLTLVYSQAGKKVRDDVRSILDKGIEALEQLKESDSGSSVLTLTISTAVDVLGGAKASDLATSVLSSGLTDLQRVFKGRGEDQLSGLPPEPAR